MQFFYCDDTIINYEKNGLFKNIIEYLDKSFEKQKSLPTLIAYSWYLYSEGQFISQEVADDWNPPALLSPHSKVHDLQQEKPEHCN